MGLEYKGGSRENWTCISASKGSKLQPYGFRCRLRDKKTAKAYLTLSFPEQYVFDITSSTYVNIFSSLYEHFICGHDIDDGRLAWVLPCEPECYGDVVGCVMKDDGKQTMDAKQELSSSIVVGWGTGKREKEKEEGDY